MLKVAKVAVSISLDKEFDYSCPPGLEIKIGMRVLVDFNNKKRVGIVVALSGKSNISRLKPVIDVLDSQILLDAEHLDFARQLSQLYPYSRGEFLFMMLPSYLRKPRKFREKTSHISNSPEGREEEVSCFIKADSFLKRYRLWRDIVSDKLRRGSVLICFPQLTYLESVKDIIEKDFPGQVKVIHSQEREKEVFANWRKTRERSLVLGTRVAIFYYPLDLELLIVEEENSPYYFQEEKPYHNLLDIAYSLTASKKVKLVLSGDYPSLTTYRNIKDGRVKLIDSDKSTKSIEVVNLPESTKNKVIGPVLTEFLRKAIQDNRKAVVLWNRKGFAQIVCSNCGYVFKCEHCSSSLQSYLKSEEGVCPYCQKKYSLPKVCNQCNNGYLKSRGYGIQRVAGILKRIFPEARIDNLSDSIDNTQITLATSKILNYLYSPRKFDRGFVLDADLFLNHPDYDTTFNAFLYLKKLLLLFRESLYVFTRHKDYYLFKHLNNDWKDFYESELQSRKKLRLPPFATIVKITFRAKNKKSLLKRTRDLYNSLEKRYKDVYGPFEENPFKLRDKFRYSMVVKIENNLRSRRKIKKEIKGFRTSLVQIAVSLR